MADDRTIRYNLRFPDPGAHRVEVTLRVTGLEPNTPAEFWMPVWTPGSYLVREFARHLEDFTATDAKDAPLPWSKLRKNVWSVTPGADGRVTITYRLYARELSVRTNWIEGEFAFLTGAATFLTLRGREQSPHRVTVEIPETWEGIRVALPVETTETEAPRTRTATFTAPDLDTLIDSPLVAGNPADHPFTVDDVPITLVNIGEGGLWDGDKAATDVKRIVEAYRDLYGSLPLERYLFLNLIVEAGGGLEHRECSVLMTSRYSYRRRKTYVRWMSLVSHEFFHVWNVKRSRPVALGPFDYENEVYSRSLWVAEGFTAYYTDLVPHRAGLFTTSEYLDLLGTLVNTLQTTPGRARQSLEESSFDAWIKLYRRDEHTVNSTISYYTKGAVVGWLLDVTIREATGNQRSLDDVMRLLFERYSGERGYRDDEIQAAAEEVAGTSLQTFFDHAARSREELDYRPALAYLGLRFRPAQEQLPADTPKIWLGIETANQDGRLVIQVVRDGGAARRAGLQVDDEILAVGGYRVGPGAAFTERLHQYAPGERLEFLIARRDAVRIVPVEPDAHPGLPWRLELDPDASAEAVAARNAWFRNP